jgi:hypothetical protein
MYIQYVNLVDKSFRVNNVFLNEQEQFRVFVVCGNYIESVDHFFLKCNIYTEHRIQLFCGMSNLGFDIGIENILFGNASFENDKKSKLQII